jgi:hypothetical protein
MTNLSFQKSDAYALTEDMKVILNRRRAIVPWPLSVDDMMDVQYLPRLAVVIRELRDNHPSVLYWDTTALLRVEAEPQSLHVNLHVETLIPLATSQVAKTPPGTPHIGKRLIYCADTEATERLRQWAWAAQIIELENRWAMSIISKLVENCTTHQQVHRYMPELYTLLDSYYQSLSKARHIRLRMVEVIKELRATGSVRATKLTLEGISLTDRHNLKMLLAQTLLLKSQQGLGEGTVFDKTWIAV